MYWVNPPRFQRLASEPSGLMNPFPGRRGLATVLVAGDAVLAAPAPVAHANGDPVSFLEEPLVTSANAGNDARHLMAQHGGQPGGELSLLDLDIGVAHATGGHLNQEVVGVDDGHVELFNRQRRMSLMQNCCFHRSPS